MPAISVRDCARSFQSVFRTVTNGFARAETPARKRRSRRGRSQIRPPPGYERAEREQPGGGDESADERPNTHSQAGVGGLFLVFTRISMKKDAWAVGAVCAKRRRSRNDRRLGDQRARIRILARSINDVDLRH